MSAETTTVFVDAIDAAPAAATPSLGEDEQRLATAVLRLLSAGEPAAVPAAAAHAGMPVSRAERVLRSWPGVFWGGHGKVTGFWGLALADMPHRIRHAGTDLYAWCAFDPLFLARVIGDLQAATADPITGEAITYRIGEDGAISGASHPQAVLSFLRPSQP
jgi:alkylmercury lyase